MTREYCRRMAISGLDSGWQVNFVDQFCRLGLMSIVGRMKVTRDHCCSMSSPKMILLAFLILLFSIPLTESAGLQEDQPHGDEDQQNKLQGLEDLLPTDLQSLLDDVQRFMSCSTDDNVTDPFIGTLGADRILYCAPATLRLLPGVTCCTPQSVDEIQLKFLLSTPNNSSRKRIQSELVTFHDSRVRESLGNGTVVFITHGWNDWYVTSDWINETRDGWLSREGVSAVLVVDWSVGSNRSYWQAASNVRMVGAAIGYSILDWGISDRTVAMGFSLGAQTVGEAGKYVRTKSNGRKIIKECHGADPAGPFFDGGSKEMELDQSDCRLVQIIHSSASHHVASSVLELPLMRLGTAHQAGHCDFWVNCGHEQESTCVDLSFPEIINATINLIKNPLSIISDVNPFCSHTRAVHVYKSSVSHLCPYKSQSCPDCGPCTGSSCDTCHGISLNGINRLPPDSDCRSDMSKNYVLWASGEGNNCNPNWWIIKSIYINNRCASLIPLIYISLYSEWMCIRIRFQFVNSP